MSLSRMTRQRAVILETLRSVHSHPTADEIYYLVRKKLPRISLGTVYRNLDLLTSSGEIRRLSKAGEQKRFDGDISPHHHVRCAVCGRVGDIHIPLEIPAAPADAAPGFTIQHGEMEFIGVCDHCRTSA